MTEPSNSNNSKEGAVEKEETSKEPCCVFFNKHTKRKNQLRKRTAVGPTLRAPTSGKPEEEKEEGATERADNSSDEEGGGGGGGDSEGSILDILPTKRAKRASLTEIQSTRKLKETSEALERGIIYAASGSVLPRDLPSKAATYITQIDPEKEDKAKIKETQERAAKGIAAGYYMGSSGYQKYTPSMSDDTLNKAKSGPIRLKTNIRNTCTFDFQADVCKDYKETGYCGYGDNCKFLHDRGDYKTGWQLEKEWEDEQNAKVAQVLSGKSLGADSGGDLIGEDDDDDDEDSLPFACLKCRKKWTPTRMPVITKCGHLFCEQCLLNHFKKSSKCPYCKEQTGKFYNMSKRVIKKIREEIKKAIEEANNPEASAQEAAEDSGPRDVRLDKRKLAV